MKRRFLSGTAALLGAAFVLFGAASSGGAAGCTTEPQLVNVTVNQGLGGYTNLVRGKSTVVRGYWSVPSCMGTTDANGVLTNGSYIQINRETLNVKNGTAPLNSTPIPTTPASLGPTFPITNVVVASPGKKDAPADAKFIVPGSVLAPSATPGAFTASFEITVDYQVFSNGTLSGPVSKTYTTLSGSRTAITKPVAKKSNAIPILLVPMGLALDPTSSTRIVSAVNATARAFPVPDGVGPLNGTSGGIRYAISAGTLDTTGLLDANGKFCGTSGNFNTIKQRLAAFLQTWNQSSTTTTTTAALTASTTATSVTVNSTAGFPTTAGFRAYIDNELVKVTGISGNTWTVARQFEGTTLAAHQQGALVTLSTNQAQKVIGVVNEANSDTGTQSDGTVCFDGYASTVAPQGWIRLTDRSGALLDMELAHTFGVVPSSRYDGLSPYHSTHADADSGNSDTAYNTSDASYLYDDHSAMRFVDGPSPASPSTAVVTGLWSDADTVFEAADYAMILCKLGGPTTTDCSTSGTTGTDVGVAAAPAVDAFTINGFTNDTQGGTTMVSSGHEVTVTTPSDPSSPYKLVQTKGTNTRTDGVPVSDADSIHSHDGGVTASDPAALKYFMAAVPYLDGADKVELFKGSTLLWSTNKSNTPSIATAAPPPILLGPTPGPTAGSVPETTFGGTGGPAPTQRPTQPLAIRALAHSVPRTLQGDGITPVTNNTTGAASVRDAIAVDAATVGDADFLNAPPDNQPNGIGTASLDGMPTNGSSFGIMTTGDVNLANTSNTSTSTGTNDNGGNVRGTTDYDVSVLKINLNVPDGSDCLSFDFRFLSDEYPEYVGSQYNDGFIAELDTSDWTTTNSSIDAPHNFANDPSGRVVSVNSTGATSMSAANAAGTTYDGATPLLVAQTTVTSGAHVLYLSIFDQGDNVYDSAAFIDNLVIGTAGTGGCTPGAKPKEPPTTQTVNMKVTDDNPTTQDTVNYTLVCTDIIDQVPIVLAVLVPVGSDGVVTKTFDVGRPGCTIDASVSDGYSATPPTPVATSELNTFGSPTVTAAITTPTEGRKFLQYDGITLSGNGYSTSVSGDGSLPADHLSWTSTLFGNSQPGNTVTLSPPAGGWAIGPHSATLHAVDGSASADAVVNFTILADADHDGLPANIDRAACTGTTGDQDARNAGSDLDKDGLIAIEDLFIGTADPYGTDQPCLAQTNYTGLGIFLPGSISLSGGSGSLSLGGIKVPNRDLGQVPKSSVRISMINNVPVPDTAGLYATAWVTPSNVGVATFDQAKLVAFLNQNHFKPGGIVLTITGQATKGQLKATSNWRFDVAVTTTLKA